MLDKLSMIERGDRRWGGQLARKRAHVHAASPANGDP
jgi:hypothetical protein